MDYKFYWSERKIPHKITLLYKHPYWPRYLEEGHGGTVLHHPIQDFSLLGQVIGGVYGRLHPLHSEKGSQVGCI